tara:strand:+ start:9604 stop:9774 length:171 start_codon:yes stop_codon:yes gene_type:complete
MSRKKITTYYCQSCEKEIPVEEQKSIAYYFAKEFDEYYCKKCAEERHEYLTFRYTN